MLFISFVNVVGLLVIILLVYEMLVGLLMGV